MLALAGVNAAAMAVFSAIYGAGALRTLSQPAFMAALLLTFVGAVALWVRVEGLRARRNDAVARLGRAVGGFAIALLGLPTLVLAPMFALQSQLPTEAGLEHVASRVMVLLLIGLGLTAGVTAVGGLVATGAGLIDRRGP